MKEEMLLRRIRILLIGFTIGLVLSGLTAFPLEWEVSTLARILGASDSATPGTTTGLVHWIVTVRNGLIDTYAKYPFIAYGTDWLAFGHLMIAIAFIGPIRGIPFYWRLIDCSFGVVGIIPLWLARKYALALDAFSSSY